MADKAFNSKERAVPRQQSPVRWVVLRKRAFSGRWRGPPWRAPADREEEEAR